MIIFVRILDTLVITVILLIQVILITIVILVIPIIQVIKVIPLITVIPVTLAILPVRNLQRCTAPQNRFKIAVQLNYSCLAAF